MTHPSASTVKLRILGTGEAFDTGLGNNSCLLYGASTPTLLFDFGYQIPERLWALPKNLRSLDGICLSHLHADHAFGVIPFLVRSWEEKRRKPLLVIGPAWGPACEPAGSPKGIERWARELCELSYPGLYAKLPFRVNYRESRPGLTWRWRGLKFRFAPTRHSVTNLSVRVDGSQAGRRWSMAFSGDGSLTPEALRLFENVGLLVQECYTKDLLTPVHGNLREIRAALLDGDQGPQRVALTHISRRHRPAMKATVRSLSRRDPRLLWLEPGLDISLV